MRNLRTVAWAWVVVAAACHEQKALDPPRAVETRPLVVFLHGMTDPTKESDAAEADVERRFHEAGFDVFAPKGKVGLCDWSEDVKAARCWPSDERSLDAAKAVVAEWQLAPARPTVIAGFSNGGAFATLLAVHGLVPACAFATMHGFPAGALHAEATERAPLLLIGGKAASWESEQLAATTKQLDAFGWPHEAKMNDGGHAIGDADLGATIAFARAAVTKGCNRHKGLSLNSPVTPLARERPGCVARRSPAKAGFLLAPCLASRDRRGARSEFRDRP